MPTVSSGSFETIEESVKIRWQRTAAVEGEEERIEFNVSMRTSGWIGIGWAQHPSMLGADMVVGW